MKCAYVAIVALGLSAAGMAPAQTAATNSSQTPPAVTSGSADSKTAAAPVAGKNSFTKGEARKRLKAHGYSNVKDLAKDDEGVWRGSAAKNGKPVSVAVDFQGNITEQ
jgi:hypothetical protein